MTEISTAEEMEHALSLMDADQHQHLRMLISEVIRCYVEDDLHGLLLIGRGQDKPMKVIAINATEMDAAALLSTADTYINYTVMEDAPPKENFN
jgi:hypothetical protein